MRVGGQLHAPAPLPPRKIYGTYCIGGWVGPRAGLGRLRKISVPPAFDTRTVQRVASCYTDYAIAVHIKWSVRHK